MRASFFEFNVAASALHTARAFMNTTGHNIANAELPGFSRQQVQAQAGVPLSLRDGRGMYGTGSMATGIIQIRDRFMDQRFWHQRAVQGEFIAKTTHLQFVETVFNNLPDAGVLRIFNDFFRSVSDLTGDTPSPTPQTNVITGAESLAELIRHQALALQRQQLDINREIADTVTIINSLGSQLTNLNRQIHFFERDGSNANDLRDQRNLLIDQLSQIVNVTVSERDFSTDISPNDRRTFIQINGHEFVSHTWHEPLEVVPRTTSQRRNEMDADGLFDIRFANGVAFNIYHPTLMGTLKGLIDVRDGNHSQITQIDIPVWPRGFDELRPHAWTGTWPAGMSAADFDPSNSDTWPEGTHSIQGTTTNFKGIPFYMNQLNHLVRVFVNALNEGVDANYDPIQGVTGHVHGFDTSGDTHGINRRLLFFTFEHGNDTPRHLIPGEEGVVAIWINPATGNRITTDTEFLRLRNPALATIGEWAYDTDFTWASDGADIFRALATAVGIPFFESNAWTDENEAAAAIAARIAGTDTGAEFEDLRDALLALEVYGATADEAIFDGLIDDIRDAIIAATPPPPSPGAGYVLAADPLGNPLYTLDTSRLNALNIMVNPALNQNPSWLATSTEGYLGESNNDVMIGWNRVATYQNLFREGRLVDFIIATSDHLAIDMNQSRNFQLSYQEIILHTHNQRLAVKGVDINEEMMDLVRFQSMFIAASRMINVIETVYDTLINRTGAF